MQRFARDYILPITKKINVYFVQAGCCLYFIDVKPTLIIFSTDNTLLSETSGCIYITLPYLTYTYRDFERHYA